MDTAVRVAQSATCGADNPSSDKDHRYQIVPHRYPLIVHSISVLDITKHCSGGIAQGKYSSDQVA